MKLRFLFIILISIIFVNPLWGEGLFLKEVAVVFKKEVLLEEAKKIMEEFDLPFSEGSDSSRGKAYFYSTGPKFIIHVNDVDISGFILRCKDNKKIHECYEPNWDIMKD